LAQTLRIETLDRSGRWYLTPGSRSIYDLRVRNDAKDATDCSIVIEDPASGVTVDPPTFTLRGHEVRTVTVLFSESANARTQRVLMKLCDDSGTELASFEHPLIVTGGTDCSLGLAFKDVIVEDGQLQGFALLCTVRSQSEAPCAFALSMTPHPALTAPELPAVQLEPGSGADVVIPIRWDQSKKDESGQNHPQLIEISVPVSNGKRTTRMRWDLFAQQLAAVKSRPKAEPVAVTQPEPPAAPARPAPTATPKPALIAVAEKPVTPLLMLSGQIALKCLPNPATANGVHTNAKATNGVAVIAKPEPAPAPPQVKSEAPAAAASADVMELPLFADLAAPTAPSTPKEAVAKTAAASSTWAAVITPVAAIAAESPAPTQPAQTAAAQPPTSQPAASSEAKTNASASAAQKLTPYTPARWNAEESSMAVSAVAPAPKPVSAPAPKTEAIATPAPVVEDIEATPPTRTTATLIRTRTAVATSQRVSPAGFIIGAAAVGAIAVAIFLFKPSSAPKPATQAASQAAVAVATQPANIGTAVTQPAPEHRTVTVAHVKPKAVAATPAAHATATATPTTAPATPRPATPKPAAQKPAVQKPAPAHHQAPANPLPVARPAPVQQLSQSVVALGEVEAYYGPRGRVVRVLWSAADQASANVQLIDDRGTTVSQTFVRGARQNAILYLPRRFHGALTVQVSSVGRGGERVATTTSLPPFGE
jgi:hypothetical protein